VSLLNLFSLEVSLLGSSEGTEFKIITGLSSLFREIGVLSSE